MSVKKELYVLSNMKATDNDVFLGELLQGLYKFTRVTMPLCIFSNQFRLSEYIKDLNNLVESHYKFILTYAASNNPSQKKIKPSNVIFAEIMEDAQDNIITINGKTFKGLPTQYPLKFTSGVVDMYLIIKSMNFTMNEECIQSLMQFDVILHGPAAHINNMSISRQFKQLV